MWWSLRISLGLVAVASFGWSSDVPFFAVCLRCAGLGLFVGVLWPWRKPTGLYALVCSVPLSMLLASLDGESLSAGLVVKAAWYLGLYTLLAFCVAKVFVDLGQTLGARCAERRS